MGTMTDVSPRSPRSPHSPHSPHYTAYDTRLASYVVVVRPGAGGEEILLALWNEDADHKRWTLPGGGVELQETTEQGAVREAKEETGYDVELLGLLGIETDVIPGAGRTHADQRHRDLKAVRVFYAARVVGGELTHERGGTTDEARWFPVAEVAALPRVSMVDTGLRFLHG
jgi:8-oxo-dGTP diphosphatase